MVDKLKVAAMVREIGALAPKVAKEHADQQAAFDAERSAEVKLFESVIASALPALPAISNRLPDWAGKAARGVVLWKATDDSESKRPLIVSLLEDGRLAEYSEEYSGWDENYGPTFLGRVNFVSPQEIVSNYDVVELITTLHSAIVKQNGKRVASTQEAKDGASKLNAILTLLDAAPRPATNVDALGDEIPF